LLTANTGAVTLRDLERPNLPLIHAWCCQPVGLDCKGAIVVTPQHANCTSLSWLDPRQPELVPLNLVYDYEGSEKQMQVKWTAAAVAQGSNEHLAVLGGDMGELVAADLRQQRMPLWSTKHAAQGVVSRLHVSGRMVLADTMPSVAADAGSDVRSRRLSQAVSWEGRSLAVFTGVHAVASPSDTTAAGKQQSLLACGIGNSLLVVGAAPPVAKERCSKGDDPPHNGHKSRVWERGTRHSNNRRT